MTDKVQLLALGQLPPLTAVQPPPHPLAKPSPNPHFAAIGGEPVIARLVERFYHHMQTQPCAARILAMHPRDLGEVKAVLTRYLSEWMGGPRHYSAERGAPQLRGRHMRFVIREAERDAWMVCMRAALAEVVPDAALRAELDAAFLRVADAVRNTNERGGPLPHGHG
ncbi:MAG: group II truncated hemoglobin [Polyangiales bacterium]